MSDEGQKKRTLALLTLLHGFTHLYHVALLPLFLRIKDDFKLPTTDEATLLLTVLMLAYYAPSYIAGELSDRFSRKWLLTIGLALNGLGFVLLALAPSYPLAMAAVVLAGLGGTLYHPSGMAMVGDLFHGKGGRAFGIVGIGGGAGFFLGPLYTGWRADMTGDWRAPLLELGLAGIVAAIIFCLLAKRIPRIQNTESTTRKPLFPTTATLAVFAVAIFAFGIRDMGGNGVSTLGSLFLQKVHGWDLTKTGFALSLIFLAAIISNPLFGHLSDRYGNRPTWIILTLTLGAVVAIFIPRVAVDWTITIFVVHGFFFMACYPMIEALMMEAVDPAVRGRAVGVYLTVSGGAGTVAHWLCGRWVDGMANDTVSTAYHGYYVLLAALMMVTLAGVAGLDWIRRQRVTEVANA